MPKENPTKFTKKQLRNIARNITDEDDKAIVYAMIHTGKTIEEIGLHPSIYKKVKRKK